MRSRPRRRVRLGPGGAALLGLALLPWAPACAPNLPGEPHPGLSRLWRAYQDLPEQRALALAGDPRRQWVAGMAGGEETPDDAERSALASCEQRRAVRRFQGLCRLYAVGDRIVWKEW